MASVNCSYCLLAGDDAATATAAGAGAMLPLLMLTRLKLELCCVTRPACAGGGGCTPLPPTPLILLLRKLPPEAPTPLDEPACTAACTAGMIPLPLSRKGEDTCACSWLDGCS